MRHKTHSGLWAGRQARGEGRLCANEGNNRYPHGWSVLAVMDDDGLEGAIHSWAGNSDVLVFFSFIHFSMGTVFFFSWLWFYHAARVSSFATRQTNNNTVRCWYTSICIQPPRYLVSPVFFSLFIFFPASFPHQEEMGILFTYQTYRPWRGFIPTLPTVTKKRGGREP